MTQTVEIKGVGTLEFPDGMSQADMTAAIKKNFPYLQEQTTSDPEKLHEELAALPVAQKRQAYARLSPVQKAALAAKQKADFQAAMSPDAQAQRFQQIQDQNVASMNPVSRFLAGAGKSFVDTGRGIGELVGKETPQQVADARANDAALMKSGFAKAGNIVGYGAQAVPLAMAAPESLAGGTLGRLALMAGTGAGQGYIAPYASPSEHAMNTALGAAAGPVMYGAGAVAKNALAGFASPEARALFAQGVNKLTPGQLFGGEVKRMEDAATSWPLVGKMVMQGKDRSLDAFNKSAIDQALAPIGESLPKGVPSGHAALSWAAKRANQAYDKALDSTSAKLDAPLIRDFGAIVNQAPEASQPELHKVLQNDIFSKIAKNPNGTISGRDYKGIMESLRKSRIQYGKGDADSRAVGQSISNVMDSMKSMFERTNGPEKMAALNAADSTYGKFRTLQDATVAAGRRRQGVMTAGDLLDAAKKSDFTKNKRLFSQGEAPFQQFANNAQELFPSSWNDSGTASRLEYNKVMPWALGAATAIPTKALYSDAVTNALNRLSQGSTSPTTNFLASFVAKRFPQIGTSAAARGAIPMATNSNVPAPMIAPPPYVGQQ